MTVLEKTAARPDDRKLSVPRSHVWEPLLSRIDLAAIVITLLGTSLLGVVAVVLAAIEMAKLVSSLWSDSFDRWLLIVSGVAVLWVAVRWKKSRI